MQVVVHYACGGNQGGKLTVTSFRAIGPEGLEPPISTLQRRACFVTPWTNNILSILQKSSDEDNKSAHISTSGLCRGVISTIKQLLYEW